MLKTIRMDLGSVCADESNHWRKCIEANLLRYKTVAADCEAQQSEFDKCVLQWRQGAGAGVQVKGENPGDPPPQCQAHSCLIGECLRRTAYSFDVCAPPMAFFKHCVRTLYGSEYVS